ncbi:7-carboxy-7-deazaguanine synthase QueE, partial [Pseudomonas citronellolis]
MNLQPIEKRTKSADGLLSLHSIFHTIQGEGPFCGTPSVFVRLAGCNLQCPACDTDYTQGRRAASVQEILDKVQEYQSSGLVVITGGEPFRQDITRLLNV